MNEDKRDYRNNEGSEQKFSLRIFSRVAKRLQHTEGDFPESGNT